MVKWYNLGRKKVIKYYRIRISDEEALILRRAISGYRSQLTEWDITSEDLKLLDRLYARLTHLKPGPPKGIRIYKKS